MIAIIPDQFSKIPYNSKHYPGSGGARNFLKGANCQLFVYELLRHKGFNIPFKYRSSELWGDRKYTKHVKALESFDIVFFNKSSNSYGSHLGIYFSPNKVIHLSKVVGYPTIWSMDEFKKYDNYKFFLGAKRLKRTWKPASTYS